VNLKKAEFVCACWIRHDLIACRRHPPFVASIEAESNVTACRNEDEKEKKVQADQHKLKFPLRVSVEDLRTANSAECCAFLEVEKKKL
jgi:hypothetical protein